MFCNNCGNSVVDNVRYCPVCGNSIQSPVGYSGGGQGSYYAYHNMSESEVYDARAGYCMLAQKIIVGLIAFLSFVVSYVNFSEDYEGDAVTLWQFWLVLFRDIDHATQLTALTWFLITISGVFICALFLLAYKVFSDDRLNLKGSAITATVSMMLTLTIGEYAGSGVWVLCFFLIATVVLAFVTSNFEGMRYMAEKREEEAKTRIRRQEEAENNGLKPASAMGGVNAEKELLSNVTISNAPIIIKKANLLLTNEGVKTVVEFQNVSDKAIIGLKMDMTAMDTFGDVVGVVENTQYLDFVAEKYNVFGGDKVIPFETADARIIKYTVKVVAFADGSRWDNESSEWIPYVNNGFNIQKHMSSIENLANANEIYSYLYNYKDVDARILPILSKLNELVLSEKVYGNLKDGAIELLKKSLY